MGKRGRPRKQYDLNQADIIRRAILDRIQSLGLDWQSQATLETLADMTKRSVGKTTIRDYLAGLSHMRSDKLASLVDALGLQVLPKSD